MRDFCEDYGDKLQRRLLTTLQRLVLRVDGEEGTEKYVELHKEIAYYKKQRDEALDDGSNRRLRLVMENEIL
jgi:hypothetical protein